MQATSESVKSVSEKYIFFWDVTLNMTFFKYLGKVQVLQIFT